MKALGKHIQLLSGLALILVLLVSPASPLMEASSFQGAARIINTPFGIKARLLAPPGVRIVGLYETRLLPYHAALKPSIMEYKPVPFSQLLLFTSSEGATIYDILGQVSASGIGLTGRNITVGVVDTGIDFSVPGLNLSSIAFTSEGRPMLLDADELGLALTPLNVTRNPYTGELNTSGSTIEVYVPGEGIAMVRVDYNWRAPVLNSSSLIYRFGFLVEYYFPSNLVIGGSAPGIAFLVPIVLVDSKEPGVYDTVFADVSSTWFTISGIYYALGLLSSPPNPSLLDFSFRDERPLKMGEGIGCIDYDGDGAPDFSIGVISGYVYDAYNIISVGRGALGNESYTWRTGWEPLGSGVYPGIDRDGKYVDFFYDPIGHGTSVAYIIAGRRASFFMPSINGVIKIKERGIAPEAKLAGAMSLMNGNVLAALYWLSGHDYANGTWIYTGKHRSDIISNSWGVIYWQYLILLDGNGFAPGGDPISYHINKVANHSIVVFASGNEGPARESVAIGGSALNAITVGASTISSNPVHDAFGHLLLPHLVGDNIISWSSRGPGTRGTLKPDLVAPGAYAIVPTAIMNGLGDGSRAVDIFGGTSMAAPVVSGSIALILQEMKTKGIQPNTSLVRDLLSSGADDLGLPADFQGNGRINVTKTLGILEENNYEYKDSRHLHAFFTSNGKLRVTGIRRDATLEIFRPVMISNTTSILTVEPFKHNYTFIAISINTTYSFLELEITVDKGSSSTPYTLIILGGWKDENNDSEIQADELYLADHALMSGGKISLYVSRDIIKALNNYRALNNGSLVLYAFNMEENVLHAYISVKAYYKVRVDGTRGSGGIAFDVEDSLIQPGFSVGYLVVDDDKIPIVIERPIYLGGADLNVSLGEVKATHATAVGGIGDLYSIPISLNISDISDQEEMLEKGSLIGYLIEASREGVDLYVSMVEKTYHGLSHIAYAYATHPPGFISGGEGFLPPAKEHAPRVFIPLPAVKGSTLLHVYVVNSTEAPVLRIYPVFIKSSYSGGSLFIKISCNHTLGEIELPGGKLIRHDSGWTVGSYLPVGNHIVLKDFSKIILSSILENGIRTRSFIGGEGVSLEIGLKLNGKALRGFIPS